MTWARPTRGASLVLRLVLRTDGHKAVPVSSDHLRQLAAAGVTEVYLRTVNTMSFPEGEVEAYAGGLAEAVRRL